MKTNKLLIFILVYIVSLPIFIWLESGFVIRSMADFIKPLLFSLSLVISLSDFYRKYLLITSLTFLGLMVVFYLFWKIDIANFFGSVGIGILTISFLGYFPKLLKNGFVEKL